MTATLFWAALNYISVLIFGVLISASFVGTDYTWRNKKGITVFIVVVILVQFSTYFIAGADVASEIYPLITHLPLILFCVYYLKRPLIMSISAVMASYLCCQTRRWFGSIFLYIFDNESLWYAVQTVVTIPLLFCILKYVSKPVYKLMKQSRKSQILFGIIPLFYYIFDYATTIYSDLLYMGARAAVEFIPSVLSIAYFGFVVLFAAETQKSSAVKEEQRFLEMQISEARRELEGLRNSQAQAAVYRHDLRHHLRYLESCIRNCNTDEALSYISSIDKTIDNSLLVRFCENETVNLILSSYAASAEQAGVDFEAKVAVGSDDFDKASAVDLCVILGNVLDNAINASKACTGRRYVSVETKRKNGRIFWLIRNPYMGEVHFEGRLPSTEAAGHGIGIKSVAMTVEKLGGMYEFIAEDGVFTVRLMI